MKATIIVDAPLRDIAEDWLDEHESELSYVSENDGCGCCVDIYYVSGPPDIIATMPKVIRGGSEWDETPASIETYLDLEWERAAKARKSGR